MNNNARCLLIDPPFSRPLYPIPSPPTCQHQASRVCKTIRSCVTPQHKCVVAAATTTCIPLHTSRSTNSPSPSHIKLTFMALAHSSDVRKRGACILLIGLPREMHSSCSRSNCTVKTHFDLNSSKHLEMAPNISVVFSELWTFNPPQGAWRAFKLRVFERLYSVCRNAISPNVVWLNAVDRLTE